jgi:hypothetical protein
MHGTGPASFLKSEGHVADEANERQSLQPMAFAFMLKHLRLPSGLLEH